jgi:phosphoribosylformimino-5-aminoimidazole carboxamide ribotide isomerase
MLGTGNESAAKEALQAYPGGLQVGGGINASNAAEWIDAGASHVIVTSWVFVDGRIDYGRLEELVEAVGGKEKVVLDLSCRKKPPQIASSPDDDLYYVVTDRWQTYTETIVNIETLASLSSYCSEFLVHGVENEGKRCGILTDLVALLSDSPIPVTYAGGVKGFDDLELVKELGKGNVDLTIGSALDIFGGGISYDEVVEWNKVENDKS